MIKTVGIYIRLSLEDYAVTAAEKLESESITNQRVMLTEYVRQSPELSCAEILEFCDDGYSGKNFDRPGVNALIDAAKNGRIQCVVVKDLSRFGRDYITVGNYISRVFPFLGIRFIAINDHFDSERKGDIDSLDTSFKTLIYDMYSRDLSAKVRSAKKNLVERGVNINPVAPYGYCKDPENKHRLLPDPEASVVVKRIFSMFAEGTSTQEIAVKLNEDHIPTPSAHRLGNRNFNKAWTGKNFWSHRIVTCILRDKQYTGCLVWGKTVRPEIGVHRYVRVDPSQWHVLENDHEAIVPKATFDLVQEYLGGEYKPRTHVKQDNPLSRKVYCGICGRAIVRKTRKHPYYCCDTPRSLPDMECSRDKVFLDELQDTIVTAIRIEARYAVDLQRIIETRRNQEQRSIAGLQKELQNLAALKDRLAQQGLRYYERYVDGTLTKDAYMKEKATLTERQKEIAEQTAKIETQLFSAKADSNRFVETYCKYAELDALTDEAAAELLDRITIYPGGRLEIRLNHADELDALRETFLQK